MSFDHPRLIVDVGGRVARFALAVAPRVLEQIASFRCAEFPDFHAAVSAYLAGIKGVDAGGIRHAAVAIANPVSGDDARMTNGHWRFSMEQMRQRLCFDNLVVVNDFTALAMSVPALTTLQRRQCGGGVAVPRSVVGLIGAGAGLGVSGLVPADDGWIALGTEGGHASFSPCDEREIAILRYAWNQYAHVSFERLLSRPGIALMFRALAHRDGLPAPVLDAPEITRRALDGSDALCRETLDVFCAVLGTAAANVAVNQGALGGIYIGGDIVPGLGSYFDQSPFRARFEDKGRLSHYLKGIPTFVITDTDATLMGAANILSSRLQEIDGARGATILGQIRRALCGMSPAEQRVAQHVLAQPRSVLNDPIAQIARSANVSQPTVIRFCRSLGCEGLTDFKLRLAAGLTGTIPITHVQVAGGDSMLELGAKVLNNSASAILQARDHLNRDSMDRAMRMLAESSRVEIFAEGHDAAVADEARFKFLRVGVPAAAYTEPHVQALAANLLCPAAVVLIISSGGTAELLDVADNARARGAKVVAISQSQSLLARKADLVLMVDPVEETATHVPMIGRILHQLMVGILVLGVMLQRGVGGAASDSGNSAAQG